MTGGRSAAAMQVIPRALAIHEAGHAVVAVATGLPIAQIDVRSKADRRAFVSSRGLAVADLDGRVETSWTWTENTLWQGDHFYGTSLRHRVVLDLAVTLAGPMAEAAYNHQSFCSMFVFDATSGGDQMEADRLLELLPHGHREVIYAQATKLAKRALRNHRRALIGLADHLQEKHHLDFDCAMSTLESHGLILAPHPQFTDPTPAAQSPQTGA